MMNYLMYIITHPNQIRVRVQCKLEVLNNLIYHKIILRDSKGGRSSHMCNPFNFTRLLLVVLTHN